MKTSVAVVRRSGATLILCSTVAAAALLVMGSTAGAAIAPTVPLATSGNYSVLGASAVTNTGSSTLRLNLGVSPGTSITGFPPGLVIAPANINRTNAVAANARADLTAAYLNAKGRPITATTTANLANKDLQAGIYAGPSHGALQLTGPLILDGAGNKNSVFIFQTNSSLVTASSSTVTLINGAQECNVFWQVGSSATLGSGSVFAGNIMALTSISLDSDVTVHGRALARNGAVTLINDTFTTPTCAQSAAAPIVPTTVPTATTVAPGSGSGTPGATVPGGGAAPGTPGVAGPPRTDATPIGSGSFPWSAVMLVGLLGGAGVASAVVGRRRAVARIGR